MAAPRGDGTQSPPRAKKCGRGWQILRNHWQEFLACRKDIPSRVLADLAPKESSRPAPVSRELADRYMEKLKSQITSRSPRSQHKLEVYKKADKALQDSRATLDRIGWPQQRRRDKTDDEMPEHEKLYPNVWWANCDENLVAELVIDAFMGDFCESLLDGAVVLVDASRAYDATRLHRGSQSVGGMSRSESAPALTTRSRTGGVFRSSGRWSWKDGHESIQEGTGVLQSRASPSASSHGAFNVAGFHRDDDWETWNRRKVHKCKEIEPYLTRVHKATNAQRPRRQLPPPMKQMDARKYIWPMAKTNFPDAWESTTKAPEKPRWSPPPRAPPPPPAGAQPVVEEDDDEVENGLIGLGRDGKSRFPYSLVLHRAFIESQPDPVLKAKAQKLAPLHTYDRY